MPLPNFLIIGAMKAGTTSLYRDLLTNPAVFMPLDKEPESLTRDDLLTEPGRQAYEALFAPAKPAHAARGEASTAYTKLPDFAGVPARARQLLGSDLKCIYLVREPVSRIVSHHHHNVSAGLFTITDVNQAVREYPELLNWTRYAMQARPWIDAFGRDNVRIVLFERYTRDRRECVAELSAWLGVEPRPDLVDVEAVYNRSEGKPVITEGWKRVRLSGAYRRLIRPLLPTTVRDRLRQALFPKAPQRPAAPTPATVDWVYDQLSDEIREVSAFAGLATAAWDREAARRKFTQPTPIASSG
jgi:hypothetical protein